MSEVTVKGFDPATGDAREIKIQRHAAVSESTDGRFRARLSFTLRDNQGRQLQKVSVTQRGFVEAFQELFRDEIRAGYQRMARQLQERLRERQKGAQRAPGGGSGGGSGGGGGVDWQQLFRLGGYVLDFLGGDTPGSGGGGSGGAGGGTP